ncbi:MAG TPA: phytanoyl-CoA dioxygenase family protein [Stellaceae bacterium]|nr:phytanoyl-CoA dioxygenase family protein [Stellaceae bacterium]
MSGQWSRAVLAPFWAAQLLSAAKSFEDNPLIGSRRLNAWGLHAARVRLAYELATRRRRRLAGLVSAEDRAAFARDGFVVRRNFLPAREFAALAAEVSAYRGLLREMAEGDTLMRKIPLDRRALAALPALRAVLRSPEWQGLVRYVGSRDAAPVVWVQSLLRHACDGPADPQTFLHADTFHPTVKAWLFLTDVAEDAGPFTYVPGSHRLTPARLAWERHMSLKARHAPDADTRAGSFRLDPEELAALGLPPPRAFAVPANTLVVADTFGFHARGPSLSPSLRVEIWAYGRRSPFPSPAPLIPWTTAGLARRSMMGWKIDGLLAAAGLKKNRWRLKTGISAFDPAPDGRTSKEPPGYTVNG